MLVLILEVRGWSKMSKEVNDEEYDIHAIGYYMLVNGLKSNSISEGLTKSLYFAKLFMKSDDAFVFKMDEDLEYVHFANAKLKNNNIEYVRLILNNLKEVIEQDKYQNINFNLNKSISNLILVPISLDNSKYVISFTNSLISSEEFKPFVDILIKSMSIILDKLELYEKLNKNSFVDSLTGLNNRNSYNEKASEIDKSTNKYIYVLFDLFRLKYINDNYNHYIGDEYIIKTAELLKKYFPKHIYIKGVGGIRKKMSTGTCAYRIGGDEFVMISNLEPLYLIEEKIQNLKKEVEALDLGIKEDLPIGINYGIAIRDYDETTHTLYSKADAELRKDKTLMYKKLGIDRRR